MPAQLQAPTSHRRHRDTPLRTHPVGDGKVVALRLVGGGIILWGLLSLIGVLVTHAPGRWLSWDRGTDAWLATHRTGLWNTLTLYGSDAANTPTVIAAAAAAVVLLRWRLGRWYESCILIVAIT